jgi:SulP family sulfate permease
MLFLAPFAKLIPMACLSGILIVVAYHMSEWRQFKSLLKGNKLDVLILLVTFFLTVFFDLIIAIEVGIVLSSFVLMKRMSESISIQNASDIFQAQNGSAEKLFEDELPVLPEGVAVYEISGALFFGAAQAFQDTINRLQQNPKVLILRMRHVPFIDSTGIHRLKVIIRQFENQEVSVILSGVNQQVKLDLEKADIYTALIKDNLLDNIDDSLKRANEILKKE